MYDIVISGLLGLFVGFSIVGVAGAGAWMYSAWRHITMKKRRYVSPIQQNGGCGSEWK